MPLVGEHRTEHDTKLEVKKPDKEPVELIQERLKLTFNTLKACERAKTDAKERFEKAALDLAYYGQSVDRERTKLNELGRMLLAEMTKPKPTQISKEMDELRTRFPNL